MSSKFHPKYCSTLHPINCDALFSLLFSSKYFYILLAISSLICFYVEVRCLIFRYLGILQILFCSSFLFHLWLENEYWCFLSSKVSWDLFYGPASSVSVLCVVVWKNMHPAGVEWDLFCDVKISWWIVFKSHIFTNHYILTPFFF